MILTGSPITNTPLDLYSQLEFLGKGCSGFTSFAAFKRFYGVFDKNPETGFERLVSFQNMPFMRERLARYSFIIRKEEALPNLPAKVTNVIEVEMTPEQRQVYDDLRKTLAAEIEGQLDSAGDNVQLVITHALTKLLRLAQITSGFLPFTTETDELTDDGLPVFQKGLYKFSPNPKLDALVEFIKSHDSSSKTIVWATWVHDIKAIAERSELEGITAVTYYGATRDADREAAKLAFNSDPNCKVFIGNAAAGGTGINLLGHTNGEQETNADHVVFYSQGWSAVQRTQAEDRAHRRGTRAPVTITDLCVAGTIDEEIRARVTKKRIMAFEISDVREILRAVLRGIIDDE
jgi:SNF2 family DNA or RNA helicase